jgi:hypothetical protein
MNGCSIAWTVPAAATVVDSAAVHFIRGMAGWLPALYKRA